MKYIAPENILLLEALAVLAPQSSKTTLRSWLKEGRVKVDNVIVKLANTPILQGQTITLGQRKKILPGDIEILYEDGDLVVVDKPAGLLSVSTLFEKGETVHAVLKAHYRPRKVFVVHRLDQDTSGVMLFALSEKAYEDLKEIFEVHAIERCYTAIVEGRVTSPSGTWESLQYEDERYVVRTTDNPNKGRSAITHYETESTTRSYSWLTLTLETGRKNQIRVHCQEAGHPVVGDKKIWRT